MVVLVWSMLKDSSITCIIQLCCRTKKGWLQGSQNKPHLLGWLCKIVWLHTEGITSKPWGVGPLKHKSQDTWPHNSGGAGPTSPTHYSIGMYAAPCHFMARRGSANTHSAAHWFLGQSCSNKTTWSLCYYNGHKVFSVLGITKQCSILLEEQ